MTSPSSARRRTTSRTPCSGGECADRAFDRVPVHAPWPRPWLVRLPEWRRVKRSRFVFGAGAVAAAFVAFAAPPDPGTLPAEPAPLASRSLLLDIAQAG